MGGALSCGATFSGVDGILRSSPAYMVVCGWCDAPSMVAQGLLIAAEYESWLWWSRVSGESSRCMEQSSPRLLPLL